MGHALRMSVQDVEARAKRLQVAKPAAERSKPGKAKKVVPTEHQEQAGLISWWNYYAKVVKGIDPRLLLAIPNGANKSMAQAAKFKLEGLRAGVPDLMLAVPKIVRKLATYDTAGYSKVLFHGLFIEMKRIGEKAKPAQIEFATLLRNQGYSVVIAQGFEEAKRAIVGYLES